MGGPIMSPVSFSGRPDHRKVHVSLWVAEYKAFCEWMREDPVYPPPALPPRMPCIL